MRLDVVGDGPMEKLGTLLGLVPSPVVHVTFGQGYSRGIVAGVRLGVFDAIGEDETVPLTVLASRTECSEAGMLALANALTGFGLLERTRGDYRLTPTARRWLRADSSKSLRDVILFQGYVGDLLGTLEDDVRRGLVERLHDREHPPEFWQAYMRALWTFAAIAAPEVNRIIRKAGALKRPDGQPVQRMLDVGGGHGRYGALLRGAVPGLRSEVLDLPPACAVGRELAGVTEHGDALSFREGDFRVVEWGADYDLVLLFNVLHNATEEESRALVRRAFEALRPGGHLVISDAAHGRSDGGGIDASAGYNELFFFLISGAQAWPEERMTQWMTEAGFSVRKRRRMMAIPQVVLCAQRPVTGAP